MAQIPYTKATSRGRTYIPDGAPFTLAHDFDNIKCEATFVRSGGVLYMLDYHETEAASPTPPDGSRTFGASPPHPHVDTADTRISKAELAGGACGLILALILGFIAYEVARDVWEAFR